MATNFPTSLDNTDSQKVVDGTNVIVAALPNNLLDMIKALQAKVGVNASTVQSSIDFFIRKNYVKVSDVKVNAHGGTATGATWNTRVLNTENNDAGNLCALSSNRITLAAGTYRCRIICPAIMVGAHAARLQNVTAGTTLLAGTTRYSNYDGFFSVSDSEIAGEFIVAASQSLEIQHYVQVGRATNGFGVKLFSDSTPNVYTVAEFWKLY